MAKWVLDFDGVTATTPKKAKEQLALSPGEIVSPEPHATIHASVSPVKPSRYFDGELTNGETIIRVVGFDKKQREKLQSYCDRQLPVKIVKFRAEQIQKQIGSSSEEEHTFWTSQCPVSDSQPKDPREYVLRMSL